MVQVGDWVLISEDADGFGCNIPDPHKPVQVTYVGSLENRNIRVDVPQGTQSYFFFGEYTVVERTGRRTQQAPTRSLRNQTRLRGDTTYDQHSFF